MQILFHLFTCVLTYVSVQKHSLTSVVALIRAEIFCHGTFAEGVQAAKPEVLFNHLIVAVIAVPYNVFSAEYVPNVLFWKVRWQGVAHFLQKKPATLKTSGEGCKRFEEGQTHYFPCVRAESIRGRAESGILAVAMGF